MDFAGDLERLLSEDLYPYRYPLTIAFVIAVLAALALAYRLGWHLVLWRRRLIAGPALAVFLIVAIPLGYYLLSPLWERNTVCEASPIPGAGPGSEKCDDVAFAATGSPPATGATGATAAASPTPAASATTVRRGGFEPRVLRQGQFAGADDFHFGEGTALLIETEPGVYALRFEEFSVRNGPDLFVYLSPDPDGYAEGALDLGRLKGTDGAFNYEVPVGTDVSRYQSAIVWCKAFSVLFATATFGPPA